MRRVLALALLLHPLVVLAQEPWLPPVSTEEQPAAEPFNHEGTVFLETGLSRGDGDSGAPHTAWNLGLDTLTLHRWSNRLVSTLNARVDQDGNDDAQTSSTSLALRELSVSWRPSQESTLDAGRMQVRDGVALGFNPTDVFRRDALLAVRTQDFNRLRESRLGVVALRSQYLKDGRGLVLLLAPELGEESTDPAWYDPRFHNTNAVAKWYLKGMPGSLGGVYGNLVLSGSDAGSRLAGINLTSNVGRYAVAYLEVAELKRSVEEGGGGDWFEQLAIGCTLTTTWRQNITLEYRYNGAQPEMFSSPSEALGAWIEAQRWQEPTSRHSVLLHMTWDRFLSDFMTLQAFWQRESADLAWAELAYRRTHVSLSLSVSQQWGGSETGLGMSRRNWATNLIARYYF